MDFSEIFMPYLEHNGVRYPVSIPRYLLCEDAALMEWASREKEKDGFIPRP